jgi:hypothetical protein
MEQVLILSPAFQVDDKVLDDIHTLMDELAESKSLDNSSESYKLGTIWEKAMDMASINAHVCPRICTLQLRSRLSPRATIVIHFIHSIGNNRPGGPLCGDRSHTDQRRLY